MSLHHKKFISIQGNIGSGKSTILKIIRENFSDLVILDEPLSSWQKVGENQDINLLGLYYDNPQRWGFTFQIYAFLTRLQKWAQFTNMDDPFIKISERSLLSDKYIFASIMKDMNILNQAEHQIYLQCYKQMSKMKKIAQIQGMIYVKCDPTICSERIKKRARTGQNEIPADYLQKLHDKHEEWLNIPKRAYSDENQTSKSSVSGASSDNQPFPEQSESNFFEDNKKGNHNKKLDIENPEKFSLFGKIDKQEKKIKSICNSFNPHMMCEQQGQMDNMSNSKGSCFDQNVDLSHGKSLTEQKVLIIDNSQPLNRVQLIEQIRSWLETVFTDENC